MGGQPTDGGQPESGAWPPTPEPQPSQWAPPTPPGAPMGPGQWQYPYPAVPKTNGMAIAALVCGIANFGCGITWVPALILGYMARNEIDRSGGLQTGREMAIAGIVLGYIGLALTVLGLLFFILVFAGMASMGGLWSGPPA